MTIIYTRDDLRKGAEDKDLMKIEFSDFRFTHEPVRIADMVIFADDEKYRIMKNRHVGKKLKEDLKMIGIRPFDITIDR